MADSINIETGVARGWAILPAAGAFDATPIEIPINMYSEVTFAVAYQNGDEQGGGGLSYTIEFSNDATNWYRIAEVNSVVPVPGADVVDLTQRVEMSYTAVGTDVERFMTPSFTTPMKWIRILCKESGSIGSPGYASVEYLIRGGI